MGKNNIFVNLPDVTKIPSAWCIFAGASDPNSDDFTPIESSHHNYTFESQDKSIVTKIRGWLKIFFKNPESIKFKSQIKLADRLKFNFDYDIMVKILDKKEENDEVVFTVMDDTDL